MTAEEAASIRNDMGLTQSQLAKRIHVNLRTVQRWEQMGPNAAGAWTIRLEWTLFQIQSAIKKLG
jgi:DNA-binding transcriptional regulator YiaG